MVRWLLLLLIVAEACDLGLHELRPFFVLEDTILVPLKMTGANTKGVTFLLIVSICTDAKFNMTQLDNRTFLLHFVIRNHYGYIAIGMWLTCSIVSILEHVGVGKHDFYR